VKEYDQNEQVKMKRKHQQKQLEKMKKKVRQLEHELSEAA